MIHSNNSNLTLPVVRLILGILAIVLSLIFSIQFVSQGNTGGAIISAIIFCLITEFAKVVFTGDCVYYWETNQGSKALFSAVIVIVLFALSISAAVFVLTISPAKEESLVNQSDSRIESLQKSIEDKKAQIAVCNPSFVSKCINPRTSELNALEGELSTILKQSDSLLDAKANQQFWIKASEYLGTNPNSLQLNFAIARAVLLDLLGLIFISQYTAAKRLHTDRGLYPLTPEEQAEQMDLYRTRPEIFKGKPLFDNEGYSIAHDSGKEHKKLLAEIERLKVLTNDLQQKQIEQPSIRVLKEDAVDLKKD